MSPISQPSTSGLFSETHTQTAAEDLHPEARKLLPLIEQLCRVAERQVAHTNNGKCPDQLEGFASRDDECPACRILIEVDRLLGRNAGAECVAQTHPATGLTPKQQAHIEAAFLGQEGSAKMAGYLLRGVKVVIFKQTELLDAPPFAVAPAEAQDFWLGCWPSRADAEAGAVALGLTVIDHQ